MRPSVADMRSGWGSRASVPWIVPDIGLFLTGFGMIVVFRVSQTYVRPTLSGWS